MAINAYRGPRMEHTPSEITDIAFVPVTAWAPLAVRPLLYAAARNPILHPKNVGSAALSTVFPDRSTLNVIANGIGAQPAADTSWANMLRPLTRSTVYRSRSSPSSRPVEHARNRVLTVTSIVAKLVSDTDSNDVS